MKDYRQVMSEVSRLQKSNQVSTEVLVNIVEEKKLTFYDFEEVLKEMKNQNYPMEDLIIAVKNTYSFIEEEKVEKISDSTFVEAQVAPEYSEGTLYLENFANKKNNNKSWQKQDQNQIAEK